MRHPPGRGGVYPKRIDRRATALEQRSLPPGAFRLAGTRSPPAPATRRCPIKPRVAAAEMSRLSGKQCRFGVVNAADLATLLGAWGPNAGHPADLTCDGFVGADDLAIMLGAWGPC